VTRHGFGFVVPTKDRPADLRRMLRSVFEQTVHPDQLIVVDGGTETVEGVVEEFPELKIEYLREYPPSLARQRNAGMAALRPDITVAGYLDDDLVLQPGASAAMFGFWARAPQAIGGTAFNIVNVRRPWGISVKRLLLIDTPRPGVVLPSGYNSSICPVAGDVETDWLFGGATMWRREVIDEFRYDEWYTGTGYLEDLDYSYRVSRRYHLAVVSDAKVLHLSPPMRRDRNFLLGKWQAINRVYFVRKHAELSLPACYWSLVGQTAVNLARGLLALDSGYVMRAWGNAVGLSQVARGRLDRLGGLLK
jgi:glycosyltransferase involved in cell wall biosynthesis